VGRLGRVLDRGPLAGVALPALAALVVACSALPHASPTSTPPIPDAIASVLAAGWRMTLTSTAGRRSAVVRTNEAASAGSIRPSCPRLTATPPFDSGTTILERSSMPDGFPVTSER